MKQQLEQYITLLFAGAPNAADIKQEILQNTLDRYDDLVEQGKTPEAAYRLAIAGIGDINEILGTQPESIHCTAHAPIPVEADTPQKRLLCAIAIALYILCPVPLFIFGDLFNLGTIGLCLMFALIAVATIILIVCKSPEEEHREREAQQAEKQKEQSNPRFALRKSIGSVVWAIGIALYFIISFTTGAWYITWVIFPIIGSIQGLIRAIFDLEEADKHES